MLDIRTRAPFGRKPRPRECAVQKDVLVRQLAKDMLKIRIETDSAIHEVKRDEAIFRRRYSHIISRVEPMGKGSAFQNKELYTRAARQLSLRRKSDPGPAAERLRSRRQSSPKRDATPEVVKELSLRRKSDPSPAAERWRTQRQSSPKLNEKPEVVTELSLRRNSDAVPTAQHWRMRRQSSAKLHDKPEVTNQRPMSSSLPSIMSSEKKRRHSGVLHENGNFASILTKLQANSKPAWERIKPSDSSENETDISESIRLSDVHMPLSSENPIPEEDDRVDAEANETEVLPVSELWETAKEKVFVDFGPSTIDKVFHALFDPTDSEEEGAGGPDGGKVEGEKSKSKKKKRSKDKKRSLKIKRFNDLVNVMHQLDARKKERLWREENVDNSMEALRKCRYLRIPGNKLEEEVKVWKF